MTPSEIRNDLIVKGILRPGHAPTIEKRCYRCGAKFETLLHDRTRLCGNCHHPHLSKEGRKRK